MLLILVKIHLQPLSHLWAHVHAHATKGGIRGTQFSPSEFKDRCSQALDYLPGPLTSLPSTLTITQAASPHFYLFFFPPSQHPHTLRTEQFDLVCAI